MIFDSIISGASHINSGVVAKIEKWLVWMIFHSIFLHLDDNINEDMEMRITSSGSSGGDSSDMDDAEWFIISKAESLH